MNEHVTDCGIICGEAATSEIINIFTKIATEQGWLPGDQITAHVHRSVYFGVNVSGRLAGGIQLELPDSTGTWSFQSVWPEVSPGENGNAAYVSMFALAKEFRGDRTLFWLPCIEMWRYCRQHAIEDLWLAATPSTLAAYRRMGWPLAVRSGLRVHWGEECFLTNMSVDSVEASIVAKASKAETYRKLVEYGYGPQVAAGVGT